MLLTRPLFRDLFTDVERALEGRHGEGAYSVEPRYITRAEDNGYRAEIEFPGIEEKDIDVSVKDGVLTVKGERKTEDVVENEGKKETVTKTLVSYRTSFVLPEDAQDEKADAHYKNGLLTIFIPKEEKKAVEKKIAIRK